MKAITMFMTTWKSEWGNIERKKTRKKRERKKIERKKEKRKKEERKKERKMNIHWQLMNILYRVRKAKKFLAFFSQNQLLKSAKC